MAAVERLSRRALLTAAGFGLAALALPSSVRAGTVSDAAAWVIAAGQARDLLSEGALLLDARDKRLRAARPVDGAVPVSWQDFTEPEPQNRGKLLPDDALLTVRLRALGVSAGKPVVVIADSRNGWGEDGRIVWTLRTLGHPQAFLVNGGVEALLAEGPLTLSAVGPGDFTVARTDAYAVTKEELRADLGMENVVILDAREPREYSGDTPYGESRGGHVPGAKPLFYKDLVDADGKMLEGDALKLRLSELGIGPQTRIVSYCTGGIRSGFVTAVLRNAGLDARNYPGSMLEWSAAPAGDFPLVTD